MNVLLKRFWFLSMCTIGELYFDGAFCCYILEDLEREDGIKIPGETCIPAGLKYKIGRVFSPRFKRVVPITYTDLIGKGDSPAHYIIKAAGGIIFSAVEIHSGNTSIDTDACQLPGTEKDLKNQRVLHSRDARDIVYAHIFTALDAHEEINYSIIDDLPEHAHDVT